MIDPIHATVTVRRPPEEAFQVFTRDMGTWWPVREHSIAVDEYDGRVKVESIVVEERLGGRIYEVMLDGAEATWATILAWDPPHRLVLAWKPNLSDNPPTEVAVTFSPHQGGTRLELEHRGWERLGSNAESVRSGYGEGWIGVLALFAKTADG